jgi:hypothetical protein
MKKLLTTNIVLLSKNNLVMAEYALYNRSYAAVSKLGKALDLSGRGWGTVLNTAFGGSSPPSRTIFKVV